LIEIIKLTGTDSYLNSSGLVRDAKVNEAALVAAIL